MTSDRADPLASAARAVLVANDVDGSYTQPASGLYPHQWSWDSALVAIGWSTFDLERAKDELRSLLAAQWRDGRIPHIAYRGGDGYFPDAARWDSGSIRSAPPDVPTSGIVQPALHALAARTIVERADAHGEPGEGTAFAHELFAPLLRWHRYLAECRDPTGSGLLTIFHPWESGLDNSPRWDPALAQIDGPVQPYARADLGHVTDPAQRPTTIDYDRFVRLLDDLRSAGYEDARLHAEHPFRVTDVLGTAIFAAAGDALFALGQRAAADTTTLSTILAWRDRAVRGLERAMDPRTGLCLDHDLVTDRALEATTLAGLAPLVAGHVHGALRSRQLALLGGRLFVGAEGLAFDLPPSTSPSDASFDPGNYWRGPIWPVTTWLFWRALRRCHDRLPATQLRQATLALTRDAGFAEYVHATTGAPRGARDQSWSAAVVLDMLAEE